MTLFFPNAISNLAEVLVSIRRLEEFLLLEERDHQQQHQPVEIQPGSSSLVKLNHATASWKSNEGDPTLDDISLDIKSGQLVAVIGTVGAGKVKQIESLIIVKISKTIIFVQGSLLQMLLGELPLESGSCWVKGRMAYTSQEPWIFGGSVRENILFGSPFNEDKYKKVIEVCALERDLQLLPFGDRTLVGDRGTSLSGGQKARINLARSFEKQF